MVSPFLGSLVLAQPQKAPDQEATDEQAVDDMVRRAQLRAQALKSTLTGIAPSSIETRTQGYEAEARSLTARNRERIRRGAGFLSPDYHIDPYADQQSQTGGVVYIAVSLSMPKASLRALAREAQKAKAVLVIRGLKAGSFKATQVALSHVFVEGEAAGLIIDPRVFQAYHIEQVPAFIVSKAEVPSCEAGFECVRPEADFDVVRGNISLHEALKLLADKGSAAPEVARDALSRMGP